MYMYIARLHKNNRHVATPSESIKDLMEQAENQKLTIKRLEGFGLKATRTSRNNIIIDVVVLNALHYS